ncbi:unnamed protein product [Adineta steineri]|uniref:t-SNARE coiled-coil homology domain-containing protein n=1 Tax=Adineta steineri TaxID=433720 RepID=A0A815IGS3_9BILA|nr:unnamed protein product [Adineta steineri]CAF1600944.1 unnamed protein product [Adineta steineri]
MNTLESQNDRVAEELAAKVARMKDLAFTIEHETKEHSRFLDTMSFEFETARSFLRRGPRHIRDVMQYSGPVDPRAIFYIIGAIVCALLFLYYVVSPSRTK